MLIPAAVKTLSKMVLGVVALGAVAGCGGGNPLKVGDGGSAGHGGTGQDGGGGSALDCGPNGTQTLYLSECDGGLFPYVRCNSTALPPGPVCPAPRCAGLDESTCSATPGCSARKCGTCGGPPVFSACYRTGDSPPVCLAIPCASGPPCSTLNDETSCSARSECTVLSCPDCQGGQTFAGCAQPGGAGVECGPCPPTCSTFDETSCKANDYCQPGYCADCNGGQKFTTCLGPNEHVVCSACPTPLELCSGLDEMSCQVTPACETRSCPDCNGGQRFLGCGVPGEEAVGCATCPAFCENVTTEAACDARPDCHSVFADLGTCDCATPGCCVGFSRCIDGGNAACKGFTGKGGITVCANEPPTCAGAYVTSFTTNCYEGCVRPTECAP